MPSPNYTNLLTLINQFIRNYPQEAFHNMELNRILQLIIQWVESGGTTGPVISSAVYQVTAPTFINATDAPIPALTGANIVVFYNALSRYLVKGTEWADLPGGGFTVLIAGYDSSVNDANFYVQVSA